MVDWLKEYALWVALLSFVFWYVLDVIAKEEIKAAYQSVKKLGKAKWQQLMSKAPTESTELAPVTSNVITVSQLQFKRLAYLRELEQAYSSAVDGIKNYITNGSVDDYHNGQIAFSLIRKITAVMDENLTHGDWIPQTSQWYGVLTDCALPIPPDSTIRSKEKEKAKRLEQLNQLQRQIAATFPVWRRQVHG